jgi:peptide/nickel transport system permease protein
LIRGCDTDDRASKEPLVAVSADRPSPEPSAPIPEFEDGVERTDVSVGRRILDVFTQNRLAVVGVGIIVFFIVFSFVGPLVYHTDQVHTNLLEVTKPPGNGHPLGTDEVGYDVLGRLMLGGQSTLEVGLAAALLATVVGTSWGAIAGFAGGWLDGLMMRIVDSWLAIPPLLLVLMLASIFSPTIPVLILVIAMVSWLGTARLVRGESLALRGREFVQAARFVGVSNRKAIARHIVPNVIGTVVVVATFSVADAIQLLAALSFLGLGPPPPAANWGGMLTAGLNFVYDGYWWLIYPAGICIVLTVISFNFIGDALRDAFEVRLQQR